MPQRSAPRCHWLLARPLADLKRMIIQASEPCERAVNFIKTTAGRRSHCEYLPTLAQSGEMEAADVNTGLVSGDLARLWRYLDESSNKIASLPQVSPSSRQHPGLKVQSAAIQI